MVTRYLTRSELELLRAQMPSEHWLVLWVCVETGLRIGDVVALRGIHISDETIHYRASKTKKDGTAKISTALSAALSARLSEPQAWLFPSSHKRDAHITRQAVWYRLKKACKRAGINADGVSPHSLRKVFAVSLYRREGLQSVQRALQHDRSATSRIYVLSDFTSGANAALPLLRRDLDIIIEYVIHELSHRK